MAARGASRQLSGYVQIDGAYLSGERNGSNPGRGSENKQAFLIAAQTDAALEHPTYTVIEPVRSFDPNLAQEHHALQAQCAQALQAGEQLRTELAAVRKNLESEREHRRQAESNAIGLTARIQVLDEMLVRIQSASASASAADSRRKTSKSWD